MLFYYHYNLIHFYRLKKSLAPPWEYSGYEYACDRTALL